MTLTEIALLAHYIHTTYFDTDEKIQVISSDDTKKTVVSYIKQLHSSRKSIDIYLRKLDYKQFNIMGRLQRYEDKAIVYFSDDINNCWSRFVATKELSHLIIDTDRASLTTNIDIIVDWILDGLNSGVDKATDSEHLATILATEILVPYKTSQPLIKDRTISTYDIALKYSVPKRIIETLRLPDYISLRDEAYSTIE